MKIQKMRATFGTLENAKLELGGGLNILEAPNESGKSTWCAFLRSMLYGVSTSQREKAGMLPDKKRYLPWQGGLMQGAMELTHNGREITMERTSRPNLPMNKLIAVYKGTFDKVQELDGFSLEAGEKLTGVPEDVFARTAFIGQSNVQVSQTPELERRIGAIVSTGDESVSATEVTGRLYAWRRSLQNGRGGGTLVKAQQELEKTKTRLQELEEKHNALAELRRYQEKLQEQQGQLEADLAIHEKLSQRSEQQRILDAGKKARLAAEDAENMRRRLQYRGRPVKAEDLGDIQAAYAAFETLAGACVSENDRMREAQEQHAAALEAKNRFAFADLTEEEVSTSASRLAELIPAVQAEQTKPKRSPLLMLPLAAALIALLLGAASVLWFPATGVLIPCALVLLGGVAAYFVLRGRKMPMPATEEMQQLLTRYRYPSPELLIRDAGAFSAVCARESTLQASAAEAETRFSASREEARAAADCALEKAQLLDGRLQDVRQIPRLLADTRAAMEELQKAEADAAALQSAYEALCSGYEGDLAQEMEYLPIPMRSEEDTRAALERTRQKREDVLRQLTLAEGALRVSGDPAVIAGQIRSLEQEVAENQAKYDALTLALQEMEAAATELQTRFSPMLGKIASEYLARLSGGKYDKVAFDKTFAALVTPQGDDVAREALYLSQGALDQMYLSLRLAMCRLLLSGDEPCPIVLDDALTNFDDERAKAALELLQEIAQERQVLLFTCHSREAAIAGSWPGVKVTKL